MFEGFWGNPGITQAIGQMVASGRLPQTLLFSGPEGVGKATLARRIGAQLLDHAELIERDDLSLPERIKNTVYNDGTKVIEQAKVEEKLRELGITMRLDSFVDQATEKRVANVIREMMIEKGYQDVKVEPVHEPIAGSQKAVALKFKVTEGPKAESGGA